MLASPIMWPEAPESRIQDSNFSLGIAKALSVLPFWLKQLVLLTEFWNKLAYAKTFWRAFNCPLVKGLLSILEHRSLVEVAAAVPHLCLVCSLAVSHGDPNTYPVCVPSFNSAHSLVFLSCLGWNLNTLEQPTLKLHWLMNQASLLVYFLQIGFQKRLLW